VPTCPKDVADQLAAEFGSIEERIACLTRSRDTISNFPARTRREVLEQQ
jgi:hypothetical protein